MTENPFSKMRVEQLMKTEVVTLRAGTTVGEAWEILREKRISGAPVVSETGDFVGVISQQDLVRGLLSPAEQDSSRSAYYYALPSVESGFMPSDDLLRSARESAVETLMNPYVLTIEPKAFLSEAARLMKEHHIHRLVVARGKELVGVVSTFDLLSLFVE